MFMRVDALLVQRLHEGNAVSEGMFRGVMRNGEMESVSVFCV